MSRSIRILAVVGLLSSVPPGLVPPATAFDRQHAGAAAADDGPEGYLPRLSAATGRLCVKQCPDDDLPCDPSSFKIADGRCATQWR